MKTAGAEAVGRVIQKRELVHPGTYVGKGKIEEIRELLWELDETGIVCDDELSPAQLNNLERELDGYSGCEGNGPDDGHSGYFCRTGFYK